MKEGSLRAQIILLIIITMGSSFFYLPSSAKMIGFVTTLGLLLISSIINYTYGMLLFIGYRETKAKTYNECMAAVLGNRLGFFSNLVIFTHTFAAVLSVWIFSFRYLADAAMILFEFEKTDPAYTIFKYGYFSVTFLMLFIVSLIRRVEKLKFFALIGIGLIIYIILSFIYLTPRYYKYYTDLKDLNFVAFKWDWYIFKVFGICLFLFLNQYAIIPMCNVLRETTQKRLSKIIFRAIGTLIVFDLIVLSTGYFSEPDTPTNEIFLLRKSIEPHDYLILIGKIGFGITLTIGMMVKCCYLILYLDQLILGFRKYFLGAHPPEAADLENSETPDETQTNLSIAYIVRNFIYLGLKGTLAVLLMDKLSFVLSMTGSVVGMFEIVIFPTFMILRLNNTRKRVLSSGEKCLLIISSIVLVGLCIASATYNIIH